MEILALAIESALKNKLEKVESLKKMRIHLGILQNLIRTENELKILDDKAYLRLSGQLTKISQDTNNWLNYVLNQKESN